MKRSLILLLLVLSAFHLMAEEHTLHVLSTGDVHGYWFDEPYAGGRQKTSMMAVKAAVDGIRDAVGTENVLLVDAGDCLQGDQAAYYYNYVETTKPHLFPRLMSYMGYDAVTVGNHDIETGHDVYDRVNREMAALGLPWLGANALKVDGTPYFSEYAVCHKAGLKVLVLGFTNPNMREWLAESKFSGMEFKNLIPFVQERVDAVKKKVKPHVTVVLVHSGTGNGDGKVLESQGLELFNTLKGVDVLVTSHDHAPRVENGASICMINGGARADAMGHAIVCVETRGRRVVSKSVTGEVVKANPKRVDRDMKAAFAQDYAAVRDYTLRPVGNLMMDLRSRDAYVGPCAYLDLVHTVQLSRPDVQVSFTAPLTFNGRIPAGPLSNADMFTLYPFENTLNVVRMKGSEIRNYLEYSYDSWIQTPGEHVLKIRNSADSRTGASRWSFVSRSYNFDSAAGINYTVDVSKPFGSRVEITSLADGKPFSDDGWYNVAINSYRYNGGGDILTKGAGLDQETVEGRTVARYPEIRELVAEFIGAHPQVDASLISDRNLLGNWRFVPEDTASSMLEADMKLIF